MTKAQKIWFAVFLAMFLVPEVLWGLIGNFLYNNIRFAIGLNEGQTFYHILKFPNSAHSNLSLKTTIFIQALGLCGLLYSLSKLRIKKVIKYLIYILVFILIVAAIMFLILINNFNPQIG